MGRRVDEGFRSLEPSTLATRPITWQSRSFRGHLLCSFLALVLKHELESRMRQKDL